jgi:hypothetical protein
MAEQEQKDAAPPDASEGESRRLVEEIQAAVRRARARVAALKETLPAAGGAPTEDKGR